MKYRKVPSLVGISGALVVHKDVEGGVGLHPGPVHPGAGGDLLEGLDSVVPLHTILFKLRVQYCVQWNYRLTLYVYTVRVCVRECVL